MSTKLTNENFIKKAIKMHGDKYDYSLVDYKLSTIGVKIICSKHGIFEQRARDHINSKAGCPICANEKRNKNNKLTKEEFVKKAMKIHGGKYDYCLVEYKSNKLKVKIVCPEHGIFEQKPNNHLNGTRCPQCSIKISKGEEKIKLFLENKGLKYEPQKTFNDCYSTKTGYKLRFDFYLPEHNTLIEFDGIQHLGLGIYANERILFNDRIKTNFAKKHNIKLLRIPFKKIKKVEEILKKELSPI